MGTTTFISTDKILKRDSVIPTSLQESATLAPPPGPREKLRALGRRIPRLAEGDCTTGLSSGRIQLNRCDEHTRVCRRIGRAEREITPIDLAHELPSVDHLTDSTDKTFPFSFDARSF